MAARRIIPLLDRVLVERVLPQTKSAGGILLPDSAVAKVRRRCGPAVPDSLWTVRPGAHALFRTDSGRQ
eukprot:scaffold175_cov414-Prasinococcus_capsulatus_cf.AAC.11